MPEALPKFCYYSDAGFETIIIAGYNDEHEQFCEFRPFHCKVGDFYVTLPFFKLMFLFSPMHDEFSNLWKMKKTKLTHLKHG